MVWLGVDGKTAGTIILTAGWLTSTSGMVHFLRVTQTSDFVLLTAEAPIGRGGVCSWGRVQDCVHVIVKCPRYSEIRNFLSMEISWTDGQLLVV